jgi:hypothetical protein
VFALSAWYVVRAWSDDVTNASLAVLGGGVLLGGVVEPAWEYWVDGETLDWTFGPLRLAALGAFVATGVITYVALVTWALRRPARPEASAEREPHQSERTRR